MGAGVFDYSASATRAAARAATGATAFTHDSAARRGAAPKLHPDLDLARKPFREARDNPDNPTSTPIAVLMDTTGSMADVPRFLVDNLSKLMKVVLEKGVVKNPEIGFGAFADATCDDVPVQMGEFEADDVLAEKHLSNIFLTGGGGGHYTESYELPLWFFANRVYTDAVEKRREKGYLFLIGDEAPYPRVDPAQAQRYLGIGPESPVPLPVVARQVQEKFHTFLIRPGGTSNFHNEQVIRVWKKILPPQQIMAVEDWNSIVPIIAGTLSVMAGESIDDTVAAMVDSGFDAGAVAGASSALVPMASAVAPMARTSGLVTAARTASRVVRL